jgi:hypothetical protein
LCRWKLAVGIKKREPDAAREHSLLAATCLANDFLMAANSVRHFEPSRWFGRAIENPPA